jgi:hypothetical protein
MIPLRVLTPDIYSQRTEHFTDNVQKLSTKLSWQPVKWNVNSMRIEIVLSTKLLIEI